MNKSRTYMPRWTRDPVWIPERFRQNAVNRVPKKPLTPEEHARQWVRMYLNRKIRIDALQGMLIALRADAPEDTDMQAYAEQALDLTIGLRDGILTEDDTREQLRRL